MNRPPIRSAPGRARAALALATSLAVLTCAPARAAEAPAPKADDERMDATIRAWVERHPDVVFEAVNRYVAEQHARQQRERDATVLGATGDLASTDGVPVLGRADARLTMVYVLDVACSYCRRSTPVIEDLLARNPDLKVVQRYVSFLTRDSEYGARVAVLVAKRYPDRYPTFYRTLMTQTARLDADLIDRVVGQVLGADAVQPVHDEATAPDNPYGRVVTNDNQVTKRLGIEGTPFVMVVGAGADGVFRGADPGERMQAAVDAARAARAQAAAAPAAK